MSHLKAVTIILGGIYMPFAMFIGYSFGAGKYTAGFISLGIYAVLSIIDGCIFWKLLEMRNDRKRK